MVTAYLHYEEDSPDETPRRLFETLMDRFRLDVTKQPIDDQNNDVSIAIANTEQGVLHILRKTKTTPIILVHPVGDEQEKEAARFSSQHRGRVFLAHYAWVFGSDDILIQVLSRMISGIKDKKKALATI